MIETHLMEHTSDVQAERASTPATAGGQPSTWAPDEFPLELRATSAEALCRIAMADVATRFPDRSVVYAADPDGAREGAGEWDPRRVAYALTILLEDALKRAPAGGPVSLRWREHDDSVVLRVQFPRPLERGDRFVTYFDEGVQPDGADDRVGTLRVLAALRIARQHRGDLARIRTRAGTAYVLTLPRVAAADAPGPSVSR